MRLSGALLVFLIVTGPAFAEDPMKFVYFEDFAPYSYREDGCMKGILIDVTDRIVHTQMGLLVSHTGYPWERAQAMVRTGEADAFISVPTPARRAYTIIGRVPVSTVTVALFSNPENSRVREIETVKTVSDLLRFTTVSYIGNGWTRKNLGKRQVAWVPTLDRALFLISQNRYDVYIGGAISTGYHIKQLGYEKTVIQLPNVLESTSLNLCIGKSSAYASILPAFDTALRALIDGGELERIHAAYR